MSVLRVLTVCTGNVCRSPAAAVMLREAVRADPRLGSRVEVQSGGLSWEAEGEPMDSRTVVSLERAGYGHPFEHTARSIHQSELPTWDLILPMTTNHAADLQRKADQIPPGEALPQIVLWRRFDPEISEGADDEELSVPDPWYEGQKAFDRTVRSMQASVASIVEHLVEMLESRRVAAEHRSDATA